MRLIPNCRRNIYDRFRAEPPVRENGLPVDSETKTCPSESKRLTSFMMVYPPVAADEKCEGQRLPLRESLFQQLLGTQPPFLRNRVRAGVTVSI